MALKTCPHCKSQIPKDASVCARCGRNVGKLDLAGNALLKLGCSILILAAVLGAAILFCANGV